MTIFPRALCIHVFPSFARISCFHSHFVLLNSEEFAVTLSALSYDRGVATCTHIWQCVPEEVENNNKNNMCTSITLSVIHVHKHKELNSKKRPFLSLLVGGGGGGGGGVDRRLALWL